MRHEAELDRKDENGVSYRDHLEAKVRKGSERARRALEPPELPDVLSYLVSWVYQLYGRSGATMAGLAPLSYTTIKDWAELMDIEVTPLEVETLIVLDGVLRNPEKDDEDDEPETRNDTWPVKNDG